MPQKDWYVFLKDHHKGPFSRDEVSDLIQKGHLKQKTYIWKRGTKDWVTLKNVEEFKDFFELTPELPPVPRYDAKSKTFILDNPQSVAEAHARRPQIKKVAKRSMRKGIPKKRLEGKKTVNKKIQAKKAQTKKSQTSGKDFSKYLRTWRQSLLLYKNKTLRSLRLTMLTLLGISGVFSAVGFYNYLHSNKIERPIGMEIEHFKEAFKVIQGTPENEIGLQFFYSKQFRKVWLATNLKGEGRVEVKIESVPYRNLTNSKITLERKATVKDHFAVFNAIADESYQPLPDGLYKVEIYSPGLKSNFEKFVGKIFGMRSQPLTESREILLSSLPAEELKARVNAVNKRMVQNKLKYESDLLQKYNSLAALSNSLVGVMERNLDNKAKDPFSSFQRDYTQSIAPLLTEISYENQKIATKFSGTKEKELEKKYSDQLSIGKMMATLAMSSIREGKSRGRLDQAKREQFLREFSKKVEGLKNKMQLKADELQARIDKYSQNFIW